MPKNIHLFWATQKLQTNDYKSWGGYLSPVEALALKKAGAKTSTDEKYLAERVTKGDNQRTWYWFSLPQSLRPDSKKTKRHS